MSDMLKELEAWTEMKEDGEMSLDKAIKSGKEKRKPYFRSGRFDRTCRPHGGCPWCESNRRHSEEVRKARAEHKENE